MKESATQNPEIASRVHSLTLENGLRIFVCPDPTSQTVSVQAWVGTGSMHEEADLGCGLSHFLEHMLFSGTEKYPGNAVSDRVTELGGDLNAYTSYENTVYYMNLPSGNLADGIDMLADMVSAATFPEERFQLEKNVILRECSMYRDRPEAVLYEEIWKQTFLKHPMRHPVIGYKEKIETVNRDMMRAYYQRRYSPGRTFFVIVGDVAPEQAFNLVRERTESWTIGRIDEPLLPVEPLQTFPRRNKIQFRDPLYRIAAGWKLPPLTHPDMPAIDILSMILGADSSSRLYKELHTRRELALNISSFSYANSCAGVCGFFALTTPEHADEVRDKALETIRDIRRHGVKKEELERAVTQQKVDYLRSMRGNGSLAKLIGASVLSMGSADAMDQYLKQLQRVTREDLLRVANCYLGDDQLNLLEMEPETAPVRKQPGKQACSPCMEPEFQRLPGGQKWICKEDNTLPLVDLTLVFPAGTLFEDPSRCGISKLISNVLFCGCEKYTEDELNELLDTHAIDLSAVTGGNAFIVKLNCAAEKFPIAMELLTASLKAPEFAEKEVRRERAMMLESLKLRESEPRQLAEDLFSHSLFGDHPYAVAAGATADGLKSIRREQLAKFYSDCCLRPDQWCISLCGAIPKKQALTAVRTLIKAIPWSKKSGFKMAGEPKFPDQPLTRMHQLKKEQAVVLYGMPSMNLSNKNREALELLQNASNTMSSSLFQNVREKNGLAYYTGLLLRMGIRTGELTYYAGTRGDSAQKVLSLFEEERQRLLKDGLGEAEFESAKASMLFSIESDIQNPGVMATLCALSEYYGTGYAAPYHKAERISRLTRKGVNAVIRKILKTDSRVSVIVTPEEK